MRSSSFTSTLSPPGSPPPTYSSAVSIDPFTYAPRPSLSTPGGHINASESTVTSQRTDEKGVPENRQYETWAYRGNYRCVAIPELAGDTVVLSATNSAGPVNPYELCASPVITTRQNTGTSQRPCGSISEMLGDLHFRVELPSNDPGPPPGYPPRSRAAPDQAGTYRASHLEIRNRTISETRPVVHRRPVPTNALSDSLLTVYELPSLSTPCNAPLPLSNTLVHSNIRPSVSETSSSDARQVENGQRPSSYTAHQSRWHMQPPIPVPNRHHSAPPVAQPDYPGSFSAESTSSWGLHTQLKAPRASQTQESLKATRMQSQKRMMDLLDSIGS